MDDLLEASAIVAFPHPAGAASHHIGLMPGAGSLLAQIDPAGHT
jgi:hypothetical protein